MKDEFSTLLIPRDVPGAVASSGSASDVVALKSTGNGDCLYNSVSILLNGMLIF